MVRIVEAIANSYPKSAVMHETTHDLTTVIEVEEVIGARFKFWAGQRLVEDIRLRPDDDGAVLSAIGAQDASAMG